MPRLDGVDISHYQGSTFPWQWVADQGCRLGACKMTEGASYVDSTGWHNRDAMAKTSLRWRGLYHFARAGDPQVQVANFDRQVGALERGEFCMVDVEAPMTPSILAVIAVMEAFEARYPGRVVRYQGKFFAAGDTDVYARWPWWLPYYSATLPATHLPVTLWQWAGGAHGVDVPGVGQVDSNQVIDEATLDRVCGIITLPLPPVVQEDDMPHFVVDETGDIWLDEIDWQGKEWADTVGNLGIDWRNWNLPNLPPGDSNVLDATRKKQSRPTPPPQVVVPLGDHFHVPGGVAQ